MTFDLCLKALAWGICVWREKERRGWGPGEKVEGREKKGEEGSEEREDPRWKRNKNELTQSGRLRA